MAGRHQLDAINEQGVRMRFTHYFIGLATLLCTLGAWAATSIAIPHPYVVYLLDGKPVQNDLFSSRSALSLTPGPHQLVIRFEGTFKDQSESRLISGEPVVINLSTKADQQLVIEFTYPRSYSAAEQYLKQQKLHILDKATGQVVKADYFVMPKKEGLHIGRNYQEELVAMGKAFAQPAARSKPAQVISGTAAVAVTATNTAQPATKEQKLDQNTQALEMLKYWYNQANGETRKAFQHWVISQQ